MVGANPAAPLLPGLPKPADFDVTRWPFTVAPGIEAQNEARS